MVVVQAGQLTLSQSSSPSLFSLLFDSTSLSLALMHSDSSFSLYPSLIFPFSLSSLLPPRTTIPPPSSAASFISLKTSTTSRLLFLVSSPLLGGTSVLLRFYILRKNNQSFAKARLICNQTDLTFDERKSGVVFGVNHGIAIKLVGSINVFAMYSVSSRKVWVFAVKMAGENEETVKLMKTAVIDCCLPVFSISVSFGFLILGEEDGVRVFPLRPLVEGRVNKHHRRLEGHRLNLPNGAIWPINASTDFYGNSVVGSNNSTNRSMNAEGTTQKSSNGHPEEKISKHSDPAKLKSVKVRQDSREGDACFVAFKSKEVKSFNSTKAPLTSVKAISIQGLSQNKFLILDSVGDIYLLSLSNTVPGSDMPCQMKKLTLTIKVQNLAVLPDISTRAQTVWISDGLHTVYTVVVSDMDSSGGESDVKENEENIQSSAIQAIFTSEKIQGIIPLAADAILILGQGNNIFTYAIS